MNVRIDVRELLAFYDARKDARASRWGLFGEELGFALLCEYFRREGGVANRLDLPCTTGARKGPRLDGWLKVVRAGTTTLYQVEVKTWGMHSIGGTALAVDATGAETEEFMRRTWQQYWTGSDFADKPLQKVLIRMKPPAGEHMVEPLACLWAAMSPNGGQDEFFSVPIQDGSFPRVYVFSMSSFLRRLSEPFLVLGLPSLNARLAHLRAIFPGSFGPI
jgi:hypothetical protein